MIDYTEQRLDSNLAYIIDRGNNYKGCSKRFSKTEKNLQKMLTEGRNVCLISPVSPLSQDDLEEYRKFFCKKAQDDGVNYIYFEDSVVAKEYNPYEGTMFDDM